VLRDVEQAEFYRLLAESRLAVIPLRENVGSSGQVVTLAAMQLGKALIVPDFGAVRQYIEPGSSGFVYEHDSDDSLCMSIRATHGDEERLATVGRAARERYERSFTRPHFDQAVVGHILEPW
jgi:glycosyltransferase involved in cell wall biosynthesis